MCYVAHPSSDDEIQWFEFTKMVPQYIFQMFLMREMIFVFLQDVAVKVFPNQNYSDEALQSFREEVGFVIKLFTTIQHL